MRLKEWLDENNYSMREFAKILEIDYGCVQKYCQDLQEPRLNTAAKIVEFTGKMVDFKDMVNLNNEE